MSHPIPPSHPRYRSLMEREKLIEGYEKGLVALQGLIAQGRGEAFDYIIGETTIRPARTALRAAAALLLTSHHPVISVNGNAAALVGRELVELSNRHGIPLEVNIFYRTEERHRRILEHLRSLGAKHVLGDQLVEGVPGLESSRRLVDPRGILKADTVVVLLEDGDRTEALRRMGKRVIAVDLNPLSRTALTADVTIVDNVTRAVPLLDSELERLARLGGERLSRIVMEYDNRRVLAEVLAHIRDRLTRMAVEMGLGDRG